MADFEDEFTDTEGTDLATHTPDVGTGYTHSNTARNAEINASNQLRAVADGALQTIHLDDLGEANHQVWFRYYDSNGTNARVCLRLANTSNYAVAAHPFFGVANQVAISKRDGTSGTQTIGSISSIADGTWVRLKAEGNTISWWTGGTGAEPSDPTEDTNWTLVDSAENSNVNTETKAGFLLWGTSLGNSTADPWIDSLRHHTLAAAQGGPNLAAIAHYYAMMGIR